MNGLGPAYLTSCLSVYTPVRAGLRSASDVTRLVVQKIHNRTLKSAANKAFYNQTLDYYQIPSVCASTLQVFKKALKNLC